ncbi:MAG TPA: hypothetical protein VNO82_22450 [Solirubrobacteraceae bacterium]|nr:hypothetical protein [Solirubrobacteraceae bacterium]
MRLPQSAFLAVVATLLAAGPATAPATAAERAKAAKPTIARVTPMRLEVGETLTIRGKRFRAKPRRNTVIFRGADGRTAFAKPRRASRRKLVVKVPASVARLLIVRDGRQRPTRLTLRVLAGRFSAFTPRRLSPVVLGIGGAGGPGDPGGPGGPGDPAKKLAACNSDADHDNDLLPNLREIEIGTDPCLLDTDGEGIEDGYEYQSARDLNDDEYQDPNSILPYPGKRPYPNPLDPSDRDIDFDGDSLTLREEQKLWRYGVGVGRAARTLEPLYYSDGNQSSIYRRDGAGKRRPDLTAAGYSLQSAFLGWAADNGYRTVSLVDHDQHWSDPGSTATGYGLLDINRDGVESATIVAGYALPELTYYDLLPDGYLSDDERDEDADGLTNFDETHGRLTAEYWDGCYASETPFGLTYAGTDVSDADSDGDGVRDGADDQDHDDIPNIMELSRLAASGLWDAERSCKPLEGLPSPPDTHHPDAYGRVNPFNPCLPADLSRTCTIHPNFAGDAAPFDGSLDWASLN